MMKLNLNDSQKTVITSIDTEIRRAADHDENGYHYYIEINGMKLKYYGNTMQRDSQRDFNKLMVKGARKEYETPYIDEQEKAHWEAVAADCANEDLHGHEVYSILSDDGNGGCFVWDYYKQTCVNKGEETKRYTHIDKDGTKRYYLFIGRAGIRLLQFINTVQKCNNYFTAKETKQMFNLSDEEIEQLYNQ